MFFFSQTDALSNDWKQQLLKEDQWPIEDQLIAYYLFFVLDFLFWVMSSVSYTLLQNSDKADTSINLKETTPSSAMNSTNEALRKRFIQIAIAVTLYWYLNMMKSKQDLESFLFRFVSITMVFLNKYLLSSNSVQVNLRFSLKQSNCKNRLAYFSWTRLYLLLGTNVWLPLGSVPFSAIRTKVLLRSQNFPISKSIWKLLVMWEEESNQT